MTGPLAHTTDLPGFSAGVLLSEARAEALPLLALVVTASLYLYAVTRLRRRGDAWSPLRTLGLCAVLGLAATLAT